MASWPSPTPGGTPTAKALSFSVYSARLRCSACCCWPFPHCWQPSDYCLAPDEASGLNRPIQLIIHRPDRKDNTKEHAQEYQAHRSNSSKRKNVADGADRRAFRRRPRVRKFELSVRRTPLASAPGKWPTAVLRTMASSAEVDESAIPTVAYSSRLRRLSTTCRSLLRAGDLPRSSRHLSSWRIRLARRESRSAGRSRRGRH